MKYDYGKKERGFNFEHYNIYESLVAMNNHEHQIVYFAFDEVMAEFGREAMNEKLVEAVKKERPDFTFFCLFTDEIAKETLRKINELKLTVTYNWFMDDHWRFDNFSRHFAPYFNFISTTDSLAPAKYRAMGYKNVIKTQWACNHLMYKPVKSDVQYGTTFVGQPHGNRSEIVAQMEAAGVPVQCYGGGWPNGRVSQEKMLEIFSNSKINLNLTKSSDLFSLKAIAKLFLNRRADNSYQLHTPLQWVDNAKSLWNKRREQIKGRNFEVPGTGGFLLTGDADNLSEYYTPDKEIAIFHSIPELIEKAKYYLNHPAEREAIAKAGYERTLREHTYEKRFNDIFKAAGLSASGGGFK